MGWSIWRNVLAGLTTPSAPPFQGGERAKTNTAAALPGFNSGATRSAELATSDGPVVTATYCFPPTVNVMGYPLTGDPRFISQSTLPVLSSYALNRPFASPPKISPPPVATSDMAPARSSCFHMVWPVSADIAHTAPTLSAPGATDCCIEMP